MMRDSDWIDLSPLWDVIVTIGTMIFDEHALYYPQNTIIQFLPQENCINQSIVGFAGEVAYALHTGKRVRCNPHLHRDNGTDFDDGTDVKTVTFWKDPILKLELHPKTWAKRYALVALDCKRMRARVVGEATAEEVRAGIIQDFTHGPRYTLDEWYFIKKARRNMT